MKSEKEILDEVWKQHRENKDSSHELKEHFCRACLDLTLKLFKDSINKLIDKHCFDCGLHLKRKFGIKCQKK